MIKLTAKELREKIMKHRKWLESEDGGERLEGAYDLRGSDLRYSNLRGSDLSGSDLSSSDLRGCDLSGAKNVPFIPFACPTHGEFTAWKKVDGRIVKLKIPADAKRCSATKNKCRCDKAEVLAIENIDGSDSDLTEITNYNYVKCVYKVGEMVYPDSFMELSTRS